jgi:pimeloyl-ACP methyl ester carboxylesterase
MYACLATATDDTSLTRDIERVVKDLGMDLKRINGDNGSVDNLQPEERLAVRSARVFVAALGRAASDASKVLYGMGIAQSGQVPILIVSEASMPVSLEGPMLSEIPKENIFYRSSPKFPVNLAERLRELVAYTSESVRRSASSDGALHNVFLSYSGTDQKYINELITFLGRNTVSYWDYDHRRHEFDVGFDERLDEAIRQSTAVVTILTPNWRRSQRAQDEVKFAKALGKKNFVLLFEEIGPIFTLTSLTVIDCRANARDGFDELLARLDEVFAEDAVWMEPAVDGVDSRGVIGRRPRRDTVPFPSAPWSGGDPLHATTSVVLLVHGIRDYALWENSIRATLEGAGFKVEPTNYGRFNLIKFLLPIWFFRKLAIEEVWRQIRIVINANPNKPISVIAHSFGTFVISHLMKEEFELKFDRIILCGSVVPYGFRYEDFQNRFATPIVNEVGTRDIWPAIAESVTFGYGSAGTYGFRRPLVRDRWHNGAGHGYFLSASFCTKYWIPFLRNGEVVPASADAEAPRVWLQLLSIFKIKFVVMALVAMLIAIAVLFRAP